MAKYDFAKMQKKLSKYLDEDRYHHTLGVMYTCASLAMAHGYDLEDAQAAGLLHDCAKCFSDDKKISVCRINNMEINSVESRNPYLLHAKAGYCIAKNKFDIEDQDILNAILNHTTGRPGMSTLEKIIYIADYIEPSRKQAPNLSEVRKLAFQNLDQALLKILTDILSYLESGGGEIDPLTKETYDYYADLLAEC